MKKDNNSNNNNEGRILYMPVGMCIGIGIGTAIGAALGNLPLYMCMGIGIGMLFGSVIDANNQRKIDEEEEADSHENADDSDCTVPVSDGSDVDTDRADKEN